MSSYAGLASVVGAGLGSAVGGAAGWVVGAGTHAAKSVPSNMNTISTGDTIRLAFMLSLLSDLCLQNVFARSRLTPGLVAIHPRRELHTLKLLDDLDNLLDNGVQVLFDGFGRGVTRVTHNALRRY